MAPQTDYSSLCDLLRPAWVKGAELHNPYKLKFPIHQYDYTFPSGHSAFVACLWLSYYFMSQQPGRTFHFHWWLHLVLGVLAVSTGYSRVYLSLHWPRGRDRLPVLFLAICFGLKRLVVMLEQGMWYTWANCTAPCTLACYACWIHVLDTGAGCNGDPFCVRLHHDAREWC